MMKVRITSWRGDHCATVDVGVAEQVFAKLTGKRTDALPTAVREKCPDTWQELQALWNPGKVTGYTPVVKHAGQDGMVGVKEFDPSADELMFLAPVVGG